MQIYADIIDRPMKVSRSDQTPALGAAIFGAVAAGKELSGYSRVEEAQEVMTGTKEVYDPRGEYRQVYRELFGLYSQLHDAFGTSAWSGTLYHVMKDLISIRQRQRKLS
jgi:L-ribulokinase